MRKPVNFNGTSGVSVENPGATSLPYTEVELDFTKDPSVTNALLFFSENTGTEDVFSLEVKDNKLQLKFNSLDGSAVVTSQAELCPFCWFHVHASKYHDVGHVSVTLLSTGGVAFDTEGSPNVDAAHNLWLNSSLQVGSLPPGQSSPKLGSSVGFLGCMDNVKYNGVDVDIWAEYINAGNPPACCADPVIPVTSLDPGASFYGFGELVFDAGSFDASRVQTIKLKFRTYNPRATLLLLAGSDIPLIFSLHMIGGKMMFEYGTKRAVENQVETTNTYNDGQWYQVIATKAGTNRLEMYREDDSQVETAESTVHSVDLSRLRGRQFAIGSEWTPTFAWPLHSTRFAGCMKDFIYSYGAGDEPRPFTSGLVTQNNVTLEGCPATVLEGSTFFTDTSFMELRVPTITVISNIEIELATTNSNGILMYVKDETSILYLALFNGNLVLETRGATHYLATSNTYISDGLLHNIIVDISNNPLLEVDKVQHLGTESISFSKSDSTKIYLGGSKTPLDQSFPVRNSFMGGITSFKINGNDIILHEFEDHVITGFHMASIAGVATPPTSPPPLPYSTPAPPPIPTCGEEPNLGATVSVDQSVLWFPNGDGWWSKTLNTEEQEFFTNSFSLRLVFKSFSEEGILLLAADNLETPTQYIVVYLKDKKIHLEVKEPSPFHQSLQSNLDYNDGQEYEIDILVFGTYLVIVESKKRGDYSAFEGGASSDSHIFTEMRQISLGGVAITDSIRPFIESLPSRLGFQGAIKEVEIHSRLISGRPTTTKAFDFTSTAAVSSAGTGDYLPINLEYGVQLDGYNSYLSFGNQVINGAFKVSMSLKNIVPSAMFLNVHQASNNFLALYTLNYRLHVSIGSLTEAFTAESTDPTNFCDGLTHKYLLQVNSAGVILSIDSNPVEYFPYPDGFQVPLISGDVIVGGLSSVSHSFQTVVTRTSVRGCISNIVINEVAQEPVLFLRTSKGATLGCPYINP